MYLIRYTVFPSLIICLLCSVIGDLMGQDQTNKGHYIQVHAEYVIPEFRDDYEDWARVFRQVADSTNFYDFTVAQDNNGFYYFQDIGSSLANLETYADEWRRWGLANPRLSELSDDYGHSIRYVKRLLWQHDPVSSYAPPDYDSDMKYSIMQIYQAEIKYGREEAVREVMQGFKQLWIDAQLPSPYDIYWNIFGETESTVSVVFYYLDEQARLEQRTLREERLDMDAYGLLQRAWNSHINKYQTIERTVRWDLSHQKRE